MGWRGAERLEQRQYVRSVIIVTKSTKGRQKRKMNHMDKKGERMVKGC